MSNDYNWKRLVMHDLTGTPLRSGADVYAEVKEKLFEAFGTRVVCTNSPTFEYNGVERNVDTRCLTNYPFSIEEVVKYMAELENYAISTGKMEESKRGTSKIFFYNASEVYMSGDEEYQTFETGDEIATNPGMGACRVVLKIKGLKTILLRTANEVF